MPGIVLGTGDRMLRKTYSFCPHGDYRSVEEANGMQLDRPWNKAKRVRWTHSGEWMVTRNIT